MRPSCSSSSMCIICSKDALLISCRSCEECHHYFLEWPPVDNTSTDKKEHPTKALQDGKRSAKASPSEPATEVPVGCCISPCQQLLAVITSDKRLLVWSRRKGLKSPKCSTSFTFYISWTLVKRPVDLVFDANSSHILVADKTGDVLRFSLRPEDGLTSSPTPTPALAAAADDENAGSPAPVLLGHLSMLLTLTMSPCGRFVVTGDRDEKVRVSHYPRAHNIASFCLGHSEFVVQLRTLPSRPHALLSGSGDGTLRIWNFETGEELNKTDTHPQSEQYQMASEDPSSQASNSSKDRSVSTEPPVESKSPSGSTPSNLCESSGDQASPSQPGRDRVVPRQCAIIWIAVTAPKSECSNGSDLSNNGSSTEKSSQGTSDLVAVCFNRSHSLALYGLTADNALRHLYTAELPRPAASVTWLDGDTLAVMCPFRERAKENDGQGNSVAGITEETSAVLVWRWSGEDLSLVPDHSLTKFAALNAHRFIGTVDDATVLYKQRFDNVAEYQKKKKTRLQQKQPEQLCCKRIKLSAEETQCR